MLSLLEVEHEKFVDSIMDRKVPVMPDKGCSEEEIDKYNKDLIRYGLERMEVERLIGLSPKNKIINYIITNVSENDIEETTETIPTIRAKDSNPQ